MNRREQGSQATQLVALAEDFALWHTADREAHATLWVGDHLEHWPVRSTTFRHLLAGRFHEHACGVASSDALNSALAALEGRAIYAGEEHPVASRVGCDGSVAESGLLYLDLCNESWEVVEVDSSGWRVIPSSKCPVRFRRSRLARPLPHPEKDGSLEDLRELVNVRDEDFPLIAGWLLGALKPSGPYPLLALHGEQGSGKTESACIIRSVIDPSKAGMRAAPNGERDLMVSAANGWVLGYDNLSRVPMDLSDALCRLSTGGGFSTRALYTDGEESVFDCCRPMILTGITELATRSDLLDRAIVLTLSRIADGQRRTVESQRRLFETLHPGILGALLNAVAAAIRNLGRVRPQILPRMADWAEWVCAAESALPWSAGTFLESYQRNQATANETALEASPVGLVLLRFMEDRTEWKGTPTQLLKELDALADDRVRRGRQWPTSARALSGELRRISPNVRAAGVLVEAGQTAGTGSRRMLYLTRDCRESPTQSSQTTPVGDGIR